MPGLPLAFPTQQLLQQVQKRRCGFCQLPGPWRSLGPLESPVRCRTILGVADQFGALHDASVRLTVLLASPISDPHIPNTPSRERAISVENHRSRGFLHPGLPEPHLYSLPEVNRRRQQLTRASASWAHTCRYERSTLWTSACNGLETPVHWGPPWTPDGPQLLPGSSGLAAPELQPYFFFFRIVIISRFW